jgi:hypothetical protein
MNTHYPSFATMGKQFIVYNERNATNHFILKLSFANNRGRL